MKSLMMFVQYVLDDSSTWCDTSTSLDLKKIEARFEHEGLSFLTITLPAFGKDLQKALDLGQVGHDHFAGFSRNGGLPRFLGGFLDHVFDRRSGRLLDDPCHACIQSLRQITLMWEKMGLECSEARKVKAIRGYIECEKEIRNADANLSAANAADFHRIGNLLWSETFSEVNREIDSGNIVPAHGPGKTADRLNGNAKWDMRVWTRRLDRVLPIGDALLPNPRYWQYLDGFPELLEPGAEPPVKVVLVPKTLKTPRVIAMEPTCMQYMQQGLLRLLTAAVKRNDIASRLVGWSSQIPNQELARIGSTDGSLATLDLSEASDRVSNQHVRMLLANYPHLFEAVDACRTRKADVQGQGVQRLAKFASMGSALTFPMESMVFMTIIFMAIERELRRPLTYKDIQSFVGRVRTFGDDIIIPVRFVSATIKLLETFGLKVNENKSFWNGKFRESCGMDYYAGTDVTLARVRSPFPARRKDVHEIISTVSLRNQLYKLGYWKSCRFLDGMIGRLIPFPSVHEGSPVLGRHTFLDYEVQRMCPKLHRPLVKGVVPKAIIPVNRLDDIGALHKVLNFKHFSDLPFADEEHLVRSGRATAVVLNSGWHTPTSWGVDGD